MNTVPLEHPRPTPVKAHTRSRPYVQEFNTTTRELISFVRKLDRAAETIADAFIKAVMDARPCTMGVGCDEYGVCYADAHGQPEQCPRRAEQEGE